MYAGYQDSNMAIYDTSNWISQDLSAQGYGRSLPSCLSLASNPDIQVAEWIHSPGIRTSHASSRFLIVPVSQRKRDWRERLR